MSFWILLDLLMVNGGKRKEYTEQVKGTYLYGNLKRFSGGMLFSKSLEFAKSAKSFRQVKNNVIALSYRVLQNKFTGPNL